MQAILIQLLGYTTFAIGLLALLTGLAILFKWVRQPDYPLRLFLGALIGVMMLLMSLLFILWR